MSLEALIPIVLKTSIFLTVLGLGLRASARDVLSLAREPSRLIRSMVATIVIMPIVAALLALSFDLNPAVKIALVALSVSPVPPLWPKRTLKAGGDESFTLGLLVAMAALSIITIPVAMEVFQRVFGIPLRMSADVIARTVLITVLLPLFLGITVRQLVPSFARDTASAVSGTGTLLLVAGLIPLLIKLWPATTSLIGDGTLAAMTAFVVIGLAAGHFLGGPARESRSVLALACASRHPAIAIAIAQVNFPSQKLVPAAIVLYLLVNAVVSTVYLKRGGRTARRGTQPVVTPRPAGARSPR